MPSSASSTSPCPLHFFTLYYEYGKYLGLASCLSWRGSFRLVRSLPLLSSLFIDFELVLCIPAAASCLSRLRRLTLSRSLAFPFPSHVRSPHFPLGESHFILPQPPTSAQTATPLNAMFHFLPYAAVSQLLQEILKERWYEALLSVKLG
jgi:hypothetical protein